MEELNIEKMIKSEPSMCNINGIMYLDPTGDMRRIRKEIGLLIDIVEDMFNAWSEATRIDDVDMRRCAMESLRDSIDRTTYCIQKLDNLLTLESSVKEVYHAEE